MAFGIIDYFAFATMLLVSAGIGVYYRFSGDRQNTNQEYLFGGGNQNVFLVAFSLMTSFVSSISMLGGSAEAFTYGTQFFVINVGYYVGTAFVVIFYLPVFYNLKNVSIYEYLELRFGRTTRLLASIAFTLQIILYAGVVLLAPSIALEALTDLSRVTSIIVIGLVCTFYSSIGGMKAVITTDIFQSVLMFLAMFAVIISACINAGGASNVWKIAQEHGRINFSEFRLDPTIRHSWWSLVIGGCFTHISLFGINQIQVQRCQTVGSLRTAILAMIISCAFVSIISFTNAYAGLAIYSRYYECDPLGEGRISKSDQLLPLYVTDTFHNIPGLTGLFVAGIFSASLSSISPALNSLAAVTLEDYIKPLCSNLCEENSSRLCKMFSLLYGLVCVIIAYAASSFESILQMALTIFGLVGGPMLGIFSLGIFIPRANQLGAVCGFICGLSYTSVTSFNGRSNFIPLPTSVQGCSNIIHKANVTVINNSLNEQVAYLFQISYMYTIVVGSFVTMVVGIMASLLAKKELINNKLLAPIVASFVAKSHNIDRPSVRYSQPG